MQESTELTALMANFLIACIYLRAVVAKDMFQVNYMKCFKSIQKV